MKNIITITSNQFEGNSIATVNARELHAYLESKQDFSTWIKARISKYSFVEDVDFVCSTNLGSKEGRGGHNAIDYHISLDMAKELSMVENNEKGREARRYFIECERKAKTGGFEIPETKAEALRLAADLTDEVERLKPLANAATDLLAIGTVSTENQLCGVRDLAKEMDVNERKLVGFGLDRRFWYRRASSTGRTGKLMPYRDYETREGGKGWFRVIEDQEGMHPHMQITPKGRMALKMAWDVSHHSVK
ncbi:antA/AntB antirepressor family protein [Idiomarina abyssalis]|uniref:antA/AntB antirepressor family protein n=1 Tax=Idiomarina abyssalis TaxID=86102 RepID=UPI003A93B15D